MPQSLHLGGAGYKRHEGRGLCQGLDLCVLSHHGDGLGLAFCCEMLGLGSVSTGGRQESGGPHEDHDQDRLISPGLLTSYHPGFHQVKCRSVVAACLLFARSQDTRPHEMDRISSERCVKVDH